MDKILIIRSGAIGDVIMATPFLKNLRENFPKSEISFLVGSWSKDVLKNNLNIDKLIVFDDKIIAKKNLFKILNLISSLRKQRFDICFILDKSWMWNFFAFLCKIKRRIGFSRNGGGVWNTLSVPFKGEKNEVDYNLELLKISNKKIKDYSPEIFTTLEDKQFAISSIKKIPEGKKIIGICPGGAINPGQSAIIKRWPLDDYIRLTKSIDATFLIFGGKEDKTFLESIVHESKKNSFDFTGISIQQAKEMMEFCDIIISHDSGSLHIASTTKNPKIIALFGPTPVKRFCPKRAVPLSSSALPCYDIYGRFKNCDENQMKEITVENVLQLVEKII